MKIILVRSEATHVGVHKLARTLSKTGHDVDLLVWDRDKKYQKVEKIDSFTVHRFRFKAPYETIAIPFYLPIWWLYEFYFILRTSPDIVHAFNLDTLPPAIVAKLFIKIRICYTILDLYGGSLPGLIFSGLRKLATFVEIIGIAFTDILFLVTETMEDEIKGARIKKVAYIYNSPEDYPNLEVIPKNTSEINIFYGGWIDGVRGIQYMISAISDLAGIKFVMAGRELDKDIVMNAKAKLDGFEYLGLIPHKEVIRRSLEADILFIFADPNFLNFKHATPNKLFEAMMCGRPIIVSEGTPMSEIVKNEDCGIVVPYGDVPAIRDAVRMLKNDPDLRNRLGQNGRRAYQTRYTWKIMEKRLVEAYRALAG